MKPKHSALDSRGKLYVACSECVRGGNGFKTCACGWLTKRWNGHACFLGELLDKFEVPELVVEE